MRGRSGEVVNAAVCKTVIRRFDPGLRLPMRKRKWSIEQLKNAVESSTSYRQVISKLGLIEAGGNYDQVKKYIKEHNLHTAHFKGMGWTKNMTFGPRPFISLVDILVEGSTYQSYKLKLRLFREKIKEEKCELCGWSEQAIDGRIPVELDHINGNRHDNRLMNLRILCPNCHSLQLTHRGLNRLNKCPDGGTGIRAPLKMVS